MSSPNMGERLRRSRRSATSTSSSLMRLILPPVNRTWTALILAMSIIISPSCATSASSSGSLFNLTVAHVNDIHVRLEETNTYSGVCKDADKGIE